MNDDKVTYLNELENNETSVNSRFNISVENQDNQQMFNGAFDLFYSLIKERKMDILNFDLTILTKQYVDFIRNNMAKLKIEDMTEYLLMATYLVELKSKKSLPTIERHSDAESEIERDKFIQRLLVYKQYQDIIPKLVEKMEKRSYMYAKESSNFDEYLNDNENDIFLPQSIDLEKILKAMQKVYLKLEGKKRVSNIKIIDVSEISIDDVELEIKEYLEKIQINKKIPLSEYLTQIPPEKFSKQYFVVTFVAFLILVRNRYINLEQSHSEGEIYIIKIDREVEISER
ncbi:MAG: segregation/condensation protein A [Mycoplasma sp.]|nr:segregation/condensation protein A [Mycoplasma sp.]